MSSMNEKEILYRIITLAYNELGVKPSEKTLNTLYKILHRRIDVQLNAYINDHFKKLLSRYKLDMDVKLINNYIWDSSNGLAYIDGNQIESEMIKFNKNSAKTVKCIVNINGNGFSHYLNASLNMYKRNKLSSEDIHNKIKFNIDYIMKSNFYKTYIHETVHIAQFIIQDRWAYDTIAEKRIYKVLHEAEENQLVSLHKLVEFLYNIKKGCSSLIEAIKLEGEAEYLSEEIEHKLRVDVAKKQGKPTEELEIDRIEFKKLSMDLEELTYAITNLKEYNEILLDLKNSFNLFLHLVKSISDNIKQKNFDRVVEEVNSLPNFINNIKKYTEKLYISEKEYLELSYTLGEIVVQTLHEVKKHRFNLNIEEMLQKFINVDIKKLKIIQKEVKMTVNLMSNIDNLAYDVVNLLRKDQIVINEYLKSVKVNYT